MIGVDAIRRTLDYLLGRKRAYQLTFSSMHGQAVLRDLMKFCRANETCFHENERVHCALTGRHEVWLRIQEHMNLSGEQLLALYGGNNFRVVTEEDDDNS